MLEDAIEGYVRKLQPEELRRILERLLPELNEAQYLAVGKAVREEGARRGLLAPRVGAGRGSTR